MPISERATYACFGAFLGGVLGVVGWWLYGLAHSLNYDGPGMDPVLRHWLQVCAGLFAVLGAVFGRVVFDLVADALAAVISFERNDVSHKAEGFYALVLLAILLAAIWFTTPSLSGVAR